MTLKSGNEYVLSMLWNNNLEKINILSQKYKRFPVNIETSIISFIESLFYQEQGRSINDEELDMLKSHITSGSLEPWETESCPKPKILPLGYREDDIGSLFIIRHRFLLERYKKELKKENKVKKKTTKSDLTLITLIDLVQHEEENIALNAYVEKVTREI